MDVTNAIIAYETGESSEAETLKLFAELIKTRMAWSLQGHYGRMASAMIDAGWITRKGELTDLAKQTFEELNSVES